MIVDSSAVVAILRQEPDAEILAEAIEQAMPVRMSVATFLETAIVVDSKRDAIASRRLDDFMREASIEVVEVSLEQVRVAREAYRDFGKGSGHRAGLNFGDVFAYALARTSGEPLLFMGDDFAATDIEPALVR